MENTNIDPKKTVEDAPGGLVKIKGPKNISKGAPSGFVISLIFHAAAFFVAGLFVVFTVLPKEEPEFKAPPPVERPKMKLKKPKVKIKKSSQPKPSSRIVAKVKTAKLPEIQIPDLVGTGEGLLGGLGTGGEFADIPDVPSSVFGSGQSIGNDFEVHIYDFKRYADGRISPVWSEDSAAPLIEQVEKFIRSDWNPASISKFYRSPRTLYASTIMVPQITSVFGPWAFGEREMYPWAYMIHYKGKLVHKEGITFRFVGMGDNYMLIRLNGKVVFDYNNQFSFAWKGEPSERLGYHLGHWPAFASPWITLEPGAAQDMEVILGDYLGVLSAYMLAVEVKGVDYPNAPSPLDNPILPIFTTSRLSRDQVDDISEYLWEDHLQLTNIPVFNDFDTGGPLPAAEVSDVPEKPKPVILATAAPDEFAKRTWTLVSGKSFEAEYVKLFGTLVGLRTADGKLVDVPIQEFSAEDLDFLELINPPKLRLSFKRDSDTFKVLYNALKNKLPPTAEEFTGGVVIRQESTMPYTRPLRVEMYVVGDEYDGDNFILMDRQIKTFRLNDQNERTFEMWGKKYLLRRYTNYGGYLRGEKYKGYLILVYDERDKVIAEYSTSNWYPDIVDKLRRFPIGRHFNKEGERVLPPRPGFTNKYWNANF